jgi:hypothetical protein
MPHANDPSAGGTAANANCFGKCQHVELSYFFLLAKIWQVKN